MSVLYIINNFAELKPLPMVEFSFDICHANFQ